MDGGPSRLHSIVERSEQHAVGVSRSLRDGVVTSLGIRDGLPPGAVTIDQIFNVFQRLHGRGEVRTELVGVGDVDAERQRGAQLRLLRGERGERLHQRVPGHRVDPDGQVHADVPERLRRVQPAARTAA